MNRGRFIMSKFWWEALKSRFQSATQTITVLNKAGGSDPPLARAWTWSGIPDIPASNQDNSCTLAIENTHTFETTSAIQGNAESKLMLQRISCWARKCRNSSHQPTTKIRFLSTSCQSHIYAFVSCMMMRFYWLFLQKFASSISYLAAHRWTTTLLCNFYRKLILFVHVSRMNKDFVAWFDFSQTIHQITAPSRTAWKEQLQVTQWKHNQNGAGQRGWDSSLGGFVCVTWAHTQTNRESSQSSISLFQPGKWSNCWPPLTQGFEDRVAWSTTSLETMWRSRYPEALSNSLCFGTSKDSSKKKHLHQSSRTAD